MFSQEKSIKPFFFSNGSRLGSSDLTEPCDWSLDLLILLVVSLPLLKCIFFCLPPAGRLWDGTYLLMLRLQAMAEICASGYRDALHFLQENSKKLQHRRHLPDLHLHLHQHAQ